MSSTEFRLGFIGTGGIARRHVYAMRDLVQRGLDGFHVQAVCDLDDVAAAEMAQDVEDSFGYRPAIYNNYEEMLEQESLDGVDICLPHGLHHQATIASMEAGVHVLCEKPLGITIRACRLMAEAADRTNMVLSTAVPQRRLPGERKAHWLINESGMLGRPLSFFHQYTRPPRRRPGEQSTPRPMTWRQDRMMSGGGPVMDSGFHYCDSMRYFYGDVETVYAQLREMSSGEPRGLDETREDTVFITLEFKNGVVGSWSWSLAAPGEQLRNIVFYGSEGSLRDTTVSDYSIFHLFWSEPRSNLVGSGRVTLADGSVMNFKALEEDFRRDLGAERLEFLFPHGLEDGFGYEIWEFMETVRGNRDAVEVDGWEGLRSMAVCEAVYESALSGNPVRVDDVISGKIETYQKPINEHWDL